MNNTEIGFLLSLGLNILVIVESVQVSLYGYAFTLRLFKHDRFHPWLPALAGMSVMSLAIGYAFFLLLINGMQYHTIDRFSTILISILVVTGQRLKTVTIWRIDYELGKWGRIRCFIAELVFVAFVTLVLHYNFGF
jgi:hypothetical protein